MSEYESADYATSFEAHRGPPENIVDYYTNSLKPLIQDASSPVVVDAGCGTGHFTIPFSADLTGSGRIVAVDRSMAMINILKRRMGASPDCSNIHILRCDLGYPPFRLAKMDLVWASDVVHAMKSLEAFVETCSRILKRGGFLAMRTSTPDNLRSYEWGEFFPDALSIDLARHYTEATLKNALRRAGFVNIDLRQIDETRLVESREYITCFAARYLSSLRMISDSAHAHGMRRLISRFGQSELVKRNARTTLVVARTKINGSPGMEV